MLDTLARPYDFSEKRAPNRLVAQAMEINSATEDGRVTPEIIHRYEELARGGWGIVFVEAISITPDHMARKHGLVISEDRLDGYKRLVERFKERNDRSLILFQLTHSGRMSGKFSRPVRAYGGDDSDLPVLTEGELDDVARSFVSACALAREAGADGVDLKSCHGYLGGELLRPGNTRNDSYGGSAENRARMISETVREVKGRYPDFLVGSRISLFEGVRGGCGTAGPDEIIEDLSDILLVLKYIVDAGADFINVSAGIPAIHPQLTRPENKCLFNFYHHFRYAKKVVDRFPGLAVIGSAYSAGKETAVYWASENIERGYVHFAGFGRQNLADPGFAGKILKGSSNIHRCILCGGCSRLLGNQERVRCIQYDKENG
ncbi:MAG: hypothetical protein JW885_16325 [Deltaproteobacteria bacterium]|nr:hypothetical protein [Candidatus Zymogenaceae bacterium]